MLLACPHCLQMNRVADERLGNAPVCGKCKQALFTGKPITLTDNNFAAIAERSELPVVIDFWASWCGPCRSFAPVFEQAARDMEPHCRFAKIDTDQQSALASRFAIRSIPTLILLRGGNIIDRQSGALPKQAFYQWLQQHAE